MALTFGAYVAPALARPLASPPSSALTAVNYLRRPQDRAALTEAIVALVLAALAVCVVRRAGAAATARCDRLWPLDAGGRARDPAGAPACCSSRSPATRASRRWARRSSTRRARSRAPSRSRSGIDARRLRRRRGRARWPPSAAARWPHRAAPLADAVRAGGSRRSRPSCASAPPSASLGVLLSLIAGVSRTMFAMAADGRPAARRWPPSTRTPGPPSGRARWSAPASSRARRRRSTSRAAIGFSSFTRARLLRDRQRRRADAAARGAPLAAPARGPGPRRLRRCRREPAGGDSGRRPRRAGCRRDRLRDQKTIGRPVEIHVRRSTTASRPARVSSIAFGSCASIAARKMAIAWPSVSRAGPVSSTYSASARASAVRVGQRLARMELQPLQRLARLGDLRRR